MSSVIYAVVFKGDLVDGFQPVSVKAHMAKLMKADAKKIAVLFSGKQIVLKKTADKAQALKYGSALKKVGADVKIKILKDQPAPALKPVPKRPARSRPEPAAAPAAGAGDFSLALNEGNIFDEAPETPPLDIDLSAMSMAEAGADLVEEHAEEVTVDLDLSEYRVAEADEGPLAEPAPEAPKVDAPDFGLDEPGAVLETLKEEVEEVNPDTSGISMAPAGSDLIDEDEKEKGPEPVVPDTSQIKLVVTFDV